MLLHGVQDAENVQEEVDDVQVEVDGGQHMLLGGELVHEEVGVIDDEGTEEESTCPGVHQLHHIIIEKQLEYSLRLSIVAMKHRKTRCSLAGK